MFVTKKTTITLQKSQATKKDMEIYVLDKLKKCLLSLAKMWNGNNISLFWQGSEVTVLSLARHPAHEWVKPSYLPSPQTVTKLGLSENHSLWLRFSNMGRARTTEEETGMFSCLSVDLFSPPSMNRAGRRELKAICTSSVTSDHMVCSVLCKGRWQLGRHRAAGDSGWKAKQGG